MSISVSCMSLLSFVIVRGRIFLCNQEDLRASISAPISCVAGHCEYVLFFVGVYASRAKTFAAICGAVKPIFSAMVLAGAEYPK